MKLFEIRTRLIAPVVVICCFVCLGSQSLHAQQGFSFPNFSTSAGVQPKGNAAVTSNGTAQVLRVTSNSLGEVGSAWYTTPFPLAKGFITTFKFQISGSNTPQPGDGFAFLIQNGCFGEGNCGASALAPTIGGSLGYDGLTNSVAIEFDTFANPGFSEVSNDELGVQSCGAGANTPNHTAGSCASHASPNFGQTDLSTSSPTAIQLADGAVHTATISYSPPSFCGEFACPNLVVVIDGEQVLSKAFDLGTLGLDANDDAFVGFTSATGGAGGFDDNHDILSWNFSPYQQTGTLGGPGTTTTFTFNTDTYKITGVTNHGGEQVTVTAVPVAKSAFPTLTSFPTETCVPYGDYSSGGVDTCVEFQVNCQVSATDTTPCNFLYLLATGYDLPADLSGGIGGPDFLVAHGVDCVLTSSSMVQSIFLSYQATVKDPTTRGGSLGPSCFVATYTPGATPIITGTRSRFVGFGSPVSNTALNLVKAGSTRPLQFQFFDNLGNPVTNLSLCNSFTPTSSGNVCADSPTVPTPWVNLTSFGIACPNSSAINLSTDGTVSFPGNSGLQNNGGGNYQLNWKTQKGWNGFCANVVVTFDSGPFVVPATLGFQFN